MITDSNELVSICKKKMEEMGYAPHYKERIFSKLDRLIVWIQKENLWDYAPEIGKKFLASELGVEYKQRKLSYEDCLLMIAINKIDVLQKTGSIAPLKKKTRHAFPEEYLYLVDKYRDMMQTERSNKQATIERKNIVLRDFLQFIHDKGKSLQNIKSEDIFAFMAIKDGSDRYRYDSSNIIRNFIEYASKIEFCDSNISKQIPHFTSRVVRKLPTVFAHDEVKQLLASFDRASAIGKRDYLMTLLVAVYGWRAADILTLELSSIDWGKNVIEFNQQKSGNYVSYPLLPEVGNAIIDYLRNGRPKTEQKCIIVSHVTNYKGETMSTANLHSIITTHMKKAGIKNWEGRRHGPHSLRHSIATNMLGSDVPLPVIQQILGHQDPETTQIYLSVDINGLRKCTFPVPEFENHLVYGGVE